MRRYADVDYDNPDVIETIDRVIHSDRDRRILKAWLCDRTSQERIAEDENVSVATVKRACASGCEKVFRRMGLI